MATPTRFPGGVTTAKKVQTLGNWGLPDVTQWHTYFNDFDTFTAAEWNITTVELGAGSASESLINEDGGVLLITNDSNDDDSDFFQLIGEAWRFQAGKPLFFKSRWKVSDATQSDIIMGLQILDSTPLTVTDGVFFQKDDGDALLDFHVEKNSTATTSTGVATLVDDTYLTTGIYYDGKTKVVPFVNDVSVGSVAVTNLPDDEDLTISFGIQNGEAVAKTMSIDYILVSKMR